MKPPVLLLLLLRLLLQPASRALEYPRELAQRNQLDAIFGQLSPDCTAQSVSAELGAKRGELLARAANSTTNANQRQPLLHLANILQDYARILAAPLEPAQCTGEAVSERLFLIGLHQDAPKSRVSQMLQSHAAELFSFCLSTKWEHQLAAQIGSLGAKIADKMHWLLESLVWASKEARDQRLEWPFGESQLTRLAARPPPAGIVLYISRFELLELDDNLKSPTLSWQDFELALRRTLLPLCRPVCERLQPIWSIYQMLFSPKLDQNLLRRRILPSASPESLQWIAGKSVCCKLVQSHDQPDGRHGHILASAYQQIVTPAESVESESFEQALMLALGANELAQMFD